MIRVKRETIETYVIPQAIFMARLGLGSTYYRALVVEEIDKWDEESKARVIVIRVERVKREVRPNR